MKKEKLKTTSSSSVTSVAAAAAVVVPDGDADWGGIKLHKLLQQALITLNFTSPTPIQRAAIPVVTTGKQDLVGAAETGSGKTLAFALPVVDFLLRNWDAYSCRISPVALIIAPTRELAMQISSVIKELCGPFRVLRKVEVVSVVGGMSEQKQRRQLCGGVNPDNGIAGNVTPSYHSHTSTHHTAPQHITSHHSTSHRITSHRTTSHHIAPHHTTSHHIAPHHITSHNIQSTQHIRQSTLLTLFPPHFTNIYPLRTTNTCTSNRRKRISKTSTCIGCNPRTSLRIDSRR